MPLVVGCGASGALHLPHKQGDVVGQRLCIFKRNNQRASDLFEGELQQKRLHLAVGVFARPSSKSVVLCAQVCRQDRQKW